MSKLQKGHIVPILTFNETEIPAKYAVCSRCNGKGTIVNPAVDGNGLTQEDFDELGDTFKEDYFGGLYDIRCEECDGLRVVLVPDEARCTKEQMKAYRELEDDEYAYQMEVYYERMAGC